MTLLINVVTPENVIQASDRRLTFQDGSFDDKSNKAVCVFCKDAHFAIAYTGLASIGGKRTDLWIVDYLRSINAPKMNVPLISEALEKETSRRFRFFPREYRRTSFVFAGYRLGMPFTALISNFETYESGPIGEAQDHFQTHVRNVRGPIRNSKRGLWIDIFGSEAAVEKPIRRQIIKLARKRSFHKQDAHEIADILVAFIRAASETRSVGKYVGRNCMTVIIKPRPEEPMVTKYHPDMNSPVQYAPHLITGVATYTNIEVWSEKPPWWK
jgi:hypothetical protein